jgi:lysophospholipase L1-like esterase
MNLGLLGLTCAVLLAIFEVTLRLSGFHFVLKPEDIQFGRPEPVMLKTGFLEDDDLFWVQPDYGRKLERLRAERPPLVLLGDSCTHLGKWHETLAARFRERHGRPLGYGNLAVAGWSSYQGMRQAQRDVPALRPKVVAAYFGWNDHWIGFGIEDKNVAQVRRLFKSRYAEIRIVQLLTKARIAWGIRDTEFPQRVSVADYGDNLRHLVEAVRAAGAVPLLFTAPSNHVPGREPKGLEERWLLDRGALIPLHRSYVEATRAVAAAEHAPLCDLEAEFGALTQDERDRLFLSDGIHFQPEGDARLAEMVDGCLERLGLWPAIVGP